MPATISDIEWALADPVAPYTVPLGPKGLTWTPQPRRRPVADPVRAERVSIDEAFAQLYEPEQIGGGFETVYFPVNGPVTYKALTRRPSATQAKTDGRCEFTQVNAPSAKMQRLAKAALNLAVSELGLRISLGWFGLAVLPSDQVLTTGDPGTAGFMWPGEFRVWVSNSLGIGETLRTITHECRHVWQFRTTNPPFMGDRAAMHRDADDYEGAFWARHGARLMAAA